MEDNFKKVSYFASHPMYTTIAQRISTFTALRDLVFHFCELPVMVFPAIKVLPHLRYLSIQYCTLPTLMDLEPDSTFSELPITELTLWFLKGELDTVPNSSSLYIMYLCTARNLRKLNIDWSPTRLAIDTINITDRERRLAELLPILESIGEYVPRLKRLRFGLYMWDAEIMYVLTSLFSDLRNVRIVFEVGSLSEQFLLSLGALFLYRLPSLESLEIYRVAFPPVTITSTGGIRFNDNLISRPSKATPVDDDDFVKVALNAWRKWCPLLRTVQLAKSSIWRRSLDGDEWCKRKLPTPPLYPFLIRGDF
ncbi:hypothetical protein C0991_006404 [Blastosporella zonata]|nr:hypothetical protein C0991_006404 [Blastosporella zonata]